MMTKAPGVCKTCNQRARVEIAKDREQRDDLPVREGVWNGRAPGWAILPSLDAIHNQSGHGRQHETGGVVERSRTESRMLTRSNTQAAVHYSPRAPSRIGAVRDV
jgi:hypothetical protein